MKKLGLVRDQDNINQQYVDAYARLFDHPLSQSHIVALALFGLSAPQTGEARTAEGPKQ